MGLELVQALEGFCRRNNTGNFHVYYRFSKEKINPSRWDGAFIQGELDRLGAAKKILVCGPPVLNETFDRFFLQKKQNAKAR